MRAYLAPFLFPTFFHIHPIAISAPACARGVLRSLFVYLLIIHVRGVVPMLADSRKGPTGKNPDS
jgi:hypothetical protein